MASKQETTTHGVSRTDPDSADESQDIMFAQRGCCHWLPFCGSHRPSSWERMNSPPESEGGWFSRGLSAFMKLREWSELVAGPRWKTFIRRFNRNRSKNGKFHYDPLSYALNFDDGLGQSGHSDDDGLYRDFSMRYAAIPVSAKSSMDLGKDAPSFT